MNNIVKLGVNLFVICAVAALALGATNQITAPIIEERNLQANNESRQAVLQDAKEFKQIDDGDYENVEGIVSEVYQGVNGSNVVGYTVKVVPKGYGGVINLIVGITTEGKITGINISGMTETPGLGTKAAEPGFSDQFKEKSVSELEVVKGSASGDNQIQAISGATITSTAVTKGVNAAIEVFNSSLNK